METIISSNMCRCCASEGTFKDIQSRYHWMGEEEVYAEMLRECFDISLSTDEANGNGGICEVCITQLRNAANFKKQVLHTEEQFKNLLQNKPLKHEIVKIELAAEDSAELESDDDQNLSEVFSTTPGGDDFEMPVIKSELEEVKPRKRAAKPSTSTSTSTSRAKKAKVEIAEPSKQSYTRCDKCNHDFRSVFNLKRHCRTKHGEDPKVTRKKLCQDCGKLFYNEDFLARHLVKCCPSSASNVCVKCNVTFDRNSDMYKHMRSLHWVEYKVLKFKCHLCDVVLKDHDEHDCHLMETHGVTIEYEELTFECEEGTDGAMTKKKKKKTGMYSATPERVEHRVNLSVILRYSNASPFRDKTAKGFSCLYCAKYFKKIDDLRAHTALDSEKEKLNIIKDYKLSYHPIKVDITNLRCIICDTEMNDLNDLREHLTDVHKKKMYKNIKDIILPFRLENGHNFKCIICSVVHVSFKNLYLHMSSHYRNYCCDTCGVGYVTIGALRKHGKTHFQGDFECNYCDKTYTSEAKKRNHERGVHKRGWLRNKCPHCPEVFVSYYDRNEHLVVAHNEAPIVFPCNACDKTYKKKYELNRHIKHHHLQHRSYLCDKCNAKFFSKRGLVDHLRKHEGVEESCSCEICFKKFSRHAYLKAHMKLHSTDAKYKCEICNKTFLHRYSLKNHVRVHQDDLDIFKEFDDVKHLIDDRELTLKQIAEESKRKEQCESTNTEIDTKVECAKVEELGV